MICFFVMNIKTFFILTGVRCPHHGMDCCDYDDDEYFYSDDEYYDYTDEESEDEFLDSIAQRYFMLKFYYTLSTVVRFIKTFVDKVDQHIS